MLLKAAVRRAPPGPVWLSNGIRSGSRPPSDSTTITKTRSGGGCVIPPEAVRRPRREPCQLVKERLVDGSEVEAALALHPAAKRRGNRILQRGQAVDRHQVEADIVLRHSDPAEVATGSRQIGAWGIERVVAGCVDRDDERRNVPRENLPQAPENRSEALVAHRLPSFEVEIDDRGGILFAQHDQVRALSRPDGQRRRMVDEVLVSSKTPLRVTGQDLRRLVFRAKRAGNCQVA